MPSTPTTMAHQSTSLELSSIPSLSPKMRHKNYVPRNTYNPMSKTRMSSPLPLQRKSWLEYKRSSQTSRCNQCPSIHYHPYCDACQTLMGWEPHQLTKPTPKHLIMSFGRLKEYCESLPTWRELQVQSPKKISMQWREEQFARAMYKRNTAKAAREALRRQAHQQQRSHGVVPPVLKTGTQMSIPS